ncbi:MAG: hypothetical protein P8K78_09050 [Pirellulales bacterium]|nr:hypothetical protein [Pirellulales bacterium]
MLRLLFHMSVILCSISLLGCSNDSPHASNDSPHASNDLPYTATATLVLTDTNELAPLFTARTPAEKSVQLERYATLITGYTVLNAVLQKPNILELECVQQAAKTHNLIEWLEKRITIKISHASEMLTISVSSSTPEQAIVLCKSVIQLFLEEVVIKERLAMFKTIDILRNQYHRKIDEVRVKRENIQELARSMGTGNEDDASPTQKLLLDQIDSYRQEINRLHFEAANKSAELSFLEKEENQTPETAKAIEKLKREIAQIKHKYEIFVNQFRLMERDRQELNEYPEIHDFGGDELVIVAEMANELGLLLEKKKTQMQLALKVIRIAIPPHVPGFEPDD